jgi:hypothetical protein
LEVFAKRQEDIHGLFIEVDRWASGRPWIRGRGDSMQSHCQCHRQVERIKWGFVNYDQMVSRTKDRRKSVRSKVLRRLNDADRTKKKHLIAHFSTENFDKSTESSGAVNKSTSWPNSVW